MKRSSIPCPVSTVSSKESLLSRLQVKPSEGGTDHEDGLEDVLYLVAFNEKAPNITIDWLIELFERSRKEGGGELVLKRIDSHRHQELGEEPNEKEGRFNRLEMGSDEVLVGVTTSAQRFNKVAHSIDLKRVDPDVGGARHLKAGDDLSYSEKQRVLLSELEGLHSQEKEVLFGVPQVQLYPGQSILQVCQKEAIITQYFPLHEDRRLQQLMKTWCFSLNWQPIHEIRDYFGETIAFYFAFLGFYTQWLIPPSVIGLLEFMFTDQFNPLCTIFYIIWITLMLKGWMRRSNELAYEWGTIGGIRFAGTRPGFRGKEMGIDPVTGQPTPVYPIRKTWSKEYGASLPLVLLCLVAGFKVMLIYFDLELKVVTYFEEDLSLMATVAIHMPGIIYALVVMFMNRSYRTLATRLNDWENHRTQSSHENHLIIKLILFEFVNNFMSIFYVAFYLQDMQMLKWQIGTMLVIYQVVDNLQEVVIPLLATRQVKKDLEAWAKKTDLPSDMAKIMRESQMPVYEDTYYDCLELFIQFGYVFLFISVFPLAPALALLNNVIEIRTDAFKLCSAHQRPHQRFASGINGGWIKAFQVMSILAVITNCALLSMSPSIAQLALDLQLSPVQTVLSTVTAEHLILSVMLVIHYVVPDVPKHVNVGLMKQHFESKRHAN